jgi:hypothetical protein
MEPRPTGGGPAAGALTSLRRFVRPRTARERCEICDAGLADDHAHLVELSTRRLLCACEACAILFSDPNAARFRRVPRRIRLLADFRMTDEAWESLQLPINLAFFLQSTPAGKVVAMYPSPAGATESPVEPEAWKGLEDENPSLRDLEPDVEALLVNRIGGARECYRVGIDECYKLVGLIRTHWRGLSGGQAAWEEIRQFFVDLKRRESHA